MRIWFIRAAMAMPLMLALLFGIGYLLLRGSLAQLDGEAELPGLSAAVELQRDALGSVTVTASNRTDAYHALGFAHAQERFFEMDLTRRAAAGELSALLGAAPLALDRQRRVHRLRARSVAALSTLDSTSRALLSAYTRGVNAGLDALQVRPWPYLLLRSEPDPWREEDSLLTVYAMFFDLQDSANRRELALHRLRRHLPAALVDALGADGSEWDAPLQGEPRAPIDATTLAGLVTPWNGASWASVEAVETVSPGSNNFAVSGALTRHGHAIVADDMHLGLRAPNIWFRARLHFADPEAREGQVDVTGLSLPGVPGIVVGSNGHVAWGFTNSYGDWFDWVRVDWEDREALRYRTAEGVSEATRHTEHIAVHGGEPESLEIIETRWGPVLHNEPDGSSLALSWAAHHTGSANFGLTGLETATDLDTALDVANRSGMPHQNVVAGDRSGRIGWTISGRLPNRVGGCDPSRPLTPLLGCEWQGWLDPAQAPRLVDPGNGRLWSANSRVADGEDLAKIGDGGYDLGARQRQIRDWMAEREQFSEADLLALQLDDRALFLQRWWQLLREVVETTPALAELELATREWQGRATPDSVSYRLTREFRSEVARATLDVLLAPAREAEGDALVLPRLGQFEALLWPLVHAPSPLLEADASGRNLLQRSALAISESLGKQAGGLAARSWAEANTPRIAHPVAAALPGFLARYLQMPEQALPGDSNLPRVQARAFGASQRMVVAPGREAEGVMHMPGGQSGHPLSPFWGAGHADWAAGTPASFLPGEAVARLVLSPSPP